MFTGIITDLGRLKSRSGENGCRFVFETAYDPALIDLGASIACSGVCLTVVEKGTDEAAAWFGADVSGETLSCTTLSSWRDDRAVNFERALKVGDELGGHMVSGHVDGVATLVEIRPQGESLMMAFEAPADLSRFIAAKGSVALDGVSLTVNRVQGTRFEVNIIPHTCGVTTLGSARQGDQINLEIDMLARYVARLTQEDK